MGRKSGAIRQDVPRFSIVLSVGGCIGSDAHDSPRRRRRTRRSTNASGQHRASGFLFDLLDDMCIATTPHRVGDVYKSLDEHLWAYSRTSIHGGKTQVLNAVDDRPEFCGTGADRSKVGPPCPGVARFCAPSDKQGVKVLGTPLGHPQFVEAYLCKKIAAQEVLLERILAVLDLQSSWSLLLHCPSARANYLWVVKPEATRAYPQRHNEGLWKCVCKILHVDPGHTSSA